MGAPRVTRVPMRASDGFALALDAFMRRTGQGGQVSQSVLELESAPDLARVRAGWLRLLEKFPILAGRVRRSWRTFLPYWEIPATLSRQGLPLGLWREPGAGTNWTPTENARALFVELIARPLDENVRLDLAALSNGRFLAALSWSHTLLDGKGAELLLAEFGRLCEGIDLPEETGAPKTPRVVTLRDCKPALDHCTALQATGTPSLNGPRARAGRGRFELLTLDDAQSAVVRERAARLGGELFPLAFYVACVVRAQDRVFALRGRLPKGYGISMPVQTRKRGARGPLFGNRVSVLQFNPRRETLASLEQTAAAMRTQFAAMTRARVSESFDALMTLMQRAPSWLFLWIIRLQFKLEICTCFCSHTGSFAPEMTHLAGARIVNAHHLAALSAPPGSGIFFGERDGLINVTISWREGALAPDELAAMIAQLRADLLGAHCTVDAQSEAIEAHAV